MNACMHSSIAEVEDKFEGEIEGGINDGGEVKSKSEAEPEPKAESESEDADPDSDLEPKPEVECKVEEGLRL